MDTNEENIPGSDLSSKDKIHLSDLGEVKDFENLSYDKETNSFELDVKGEDKDYDHPLPYDTSAPTGEDFNSTYDEANPHIGDEYAAKDDQVDPTLNDLGMHIDSGEILELDPEDEFLAKTPEDDRTDLDEEGYPINDSPPMP
jgi:hypothetical protein